MSIEQYQAKSNKAQTIFYFISEGPNGHILKKVRYTKIKHKGIKNLYSLSFGDVNKATGNIDDLIVTDNKDREKVLATVAQTIVLFTNCYPKAFVFFEGSTDTRNRLYQMAISKYLNELSNKFVIKGYFNEQWLPYKKNVDYASFLIYLKK